LSAATRRDQPRYIALTRICFAVTSNGLPVGAQTESLSASTSGDPPARTRVEAVMKRPLTQGPGGGGSGQFLIA